MSFKHYVSRMVTAHKTMVILVGCGGTGSQVISGLGRMHVALRALGHPGLSVTIYDGDAVSAANVGRQLFSPSDIGRNKAEVMTTRINTFFGLAWRAVPAIFTPASRKAAGNCEILISCVDTVKSRLLIGEIGDATYWLDIGNQKSSGQCVLGTMKDVEQPEGKASEESVGRLPTVLDLYPDLGSQDEGKQGPSCSVADALAKQDLFVNQAVVTPALHLLWTMFRKGVLTEHGVFLNLGTLSMRPLPVDPAMWERMSGTGTKLKTTARQFKKAA